MDKESTLRSAFNKIFEKIYTEFPNTLKSFLENDNQVISFGPSEGSSHEKSDASAFLSYLSSGYDTKLIDIRKEWEKFKN